MKNKMNNCMQKFLTEFLCLKFDLNVYTGNLNHF